MTGMPAYAIAHVPTEHGSRYLQQLCKHWQHRLTVSFTPVRGTVSFPTEDAFDRNGSEPMATFEAGDGVLVVRIDAGSDAELQGLKEVVASHLDRFAFREAPLPFDWRDG